jgi:hypothetical protein
MTHTQEVVEHWLGLCRKSPAVHAHQTGRDILPESSFEGRPDAGGSGPGMILHGIDSALAGMRTLNRNRQLLWFTLLAGLVFVGNTIGQAIFYYLRWNLHMEFDIPVSYLLDFFLDFATVFCLIFLLAGLVLAIPPGNERPSRVFEGLARAKKYQKAIFTWSFILTLADLLLVRMYILFPITWIHSCSFLTFFDYGSFTEMIIQFPFNWNLDWNMLTEFPGYGGRSLLLWIYPFGFMETLVFSAITLFLFILTLFVVPLMVLGQMTIKEAVVGSFSMMKKSWVEVVSCTLFLGVVVLGIFLTYLPVQGASGIVSPYNTVIHQIPATWTALAFLYDSALLTLAFLVVTVGGIATVDLYASAKARQTG